MEREYKEAYYTCDLFRQILKENQEIHEKYSDEIKKYGEYTNDVKSLFTKREKYMISVSEIIFSISNTLDELKQIPIYFKYFPKYKSYIQNRIFHDDYMKYHLKNYYIRISTLLDQLALLINEVYELGLPTRRCSVESVIENKNTKETKTIVYFKALKKGIEGIKRLRNLAVHEGYFHDKKIFNLGTFIFLSSNLEDVDYETEIKWLSKTIVKEKMEQFDNNNEALTKMIENIYNELFKEYNNRNVDHE